MTKHRIPAIITASLILAGVCGHVPQAGNPFGTTLTAFAEDDETEYKTSGGFLYLPFSGGIATIMSYTGTDSTVTIPDQIDGYDVCQVDENLFPDKSRIKKIVIETEHYSYDLNFMSGCENLEEVILPDSEEWWSVPGGAFDGCTSLKKIHLPAKLTAIGQYAFKNCKSLEEIVLPETTGSIDEGAFEGCEKLEKIQIPDAVWLVGAHAFSGTAWLKAKQKENPLVTINTVLIDGAACKGEIEIPDDIERISPGAFEDNTAITKVTISYNVNNIERFAFRNCTSLADIKFQYNLTFTSINEEVFAGCTALKEIKLPSTLTSIKEGAFSGCTALESIEIPAGVYEIQDRAFQNCTQLANIRFMNENGKINIGKYAFAGTKWSKRQQTEKVSVVGGTLVKAEPDQNGTLILPDTVRNVPKDFFRSMNMDIKKIVIPESISSPFELWGCRNLEEIEMNASFLTIPDDMFTGLLKLKKIKFSPDSIINEIAPFAFRDCSSLEEIEIPQHVTQIPNHAFENCTKLTTVKLPDGLMSIEKLAFEKCESLKNLVIPESVAFIYPDAFEGCNQLILQVYPGSYAERYCKALFRPYHVIPDLNGDNQADAADVQALRDYLLTKTDTLPNGEAADMNRDGRLNATDLALFKNNVLKGLYG